MAGPGVLTVGDIGFDAADALLARYGLALARVADATPIPGSYWGDCEAGLVGETVHLSSVWLRHIPVPLPPRSRPPASRRWKPSEAQHEHPLYPE